MGWEISLMGLIIGVLVGLTGVGGASLVTPVLVMLGINPTIAVGTDLFYNAITKLFGTWQHYRQKTIHWPLVRDLACGSVPGAILAILMLKLFDSFFHNQEIIIKHALGIMLVIVALTTILRLIFDGRVRDEPVSKPVRTSRLLTILLGFVLGFIVGLTSIGSGSLFALAMFYLFRLSGSRVVGTDIAHALLLVSAAGLMHAGFGHVDYGLAARLLVGSIPGVLIGSSLSAKVPTRPLSALVAILIMVSGLKMI